MSKKLKILKESLRKKNEVLNNKFNDYFTDVNSANGQPLNDKRNGQATVDSGKGKTSLSGVRRRKSRKQKMPLG